MRDGEAPEQAVDPRVEELNAIKVANQAALRELNRLGAALDPVGVVSTRLEALVELFLSEEGRLQFELAFERKMSEALATAAHQVRQQRLAAQPPVVNGALVLPENLRKGS